MSKSFPSIPDPTASVDSLLTTVRVLKMAVELLTGQRGAVAPNRVYTQATAPTPEQAGDMWVYNGTLLYWDGSAWIAVSTQ